MAGNQSIKELMNAEAEASKIVSSARQERGERLKQAKAEAEVEIETYRQQMENTFQLDGTDLLGDDSSSLEAETQKGIESIKKDYLSNKDAAVELMVSQASQVKLSVSAARKQQ